MFNKLPTLHRPTSIFVFFLLLLQGSLSLWSAFRENATFDEVPHLAAGYAHLMTGNFHLDPGGHPPLMKIIAGAAIAPLNPVVPTSSPSWLRCDEYGVGTEFLYGTSEGSRLLLLARLPFIVFGLLLSLTVFGWARSLWGTGAGFVALALSALNSEVLAHSHYVNSDLGFTLWGTLFLWGIVCFMARPGLLNGFWVALAFGLATITKFSFPLLVLMAFALVAASGFSHIVRMKWRLFVLGLSAVAASFFLVWAVHGFRFSQSTESGLRCARNLDSLTPSLGAFGGILKMAADSRILPEAYLTGLAFRAFEERQMRRSFLLGEVRSEGFLSFFTVALLLKTPIPLLLLSCLGAVWLYRMGDLKARLQVILPAVLYFASATLSMISLGYRHLFPMLPLLFVLAGRSSILLSGMKGRLGLFVLLGWYAIGTLGVAPHFLSYFNEIAGGPKGGHRYLVDSNCDWGQDLEELSRLVKEKGLGKIKLSYFGSGNPPRAGLDCEALSGVFNCWSNPQWARTIRTGDVLAVSVTNLKGVYMRDPTRFPLDIDVPGLKAVMGTGQFFRYLDEHFVPFDSAGYSILLFKMSPEFVK